MCGSMRGTAAADKLWVLLTGFASSRCVGGALGTWGGTCLCLGSWDPWDAASISLGRG